VVPRRLSIIVPVRNGGSALAALLDCLATLSVPRDWEKELIVGYQQSTDDTLETLRARDVRIVFDDAVGPSSNRNAATRESDGELLYFIDADALPARSDLLERLIEAATKLDDFGACGGPILIDPAQIDNPIALADHLASWFLWHPHRRSGRSLFQPSTSLLVPRSVFDKVGGFDESLSVLEDFEFEQRIKKLGLAIYFVQPAPVTHRARGTLVSSLRHSWHWGLPVRRDFLGALSKKRFVFRDRPELFWINLPRIYLRRLKLVLRQSWRHSKRQTLYCLPFLALTVLAWAAAVAFGHGRPPQ
jgi:GT2 family glycosyltransferase